MHAPSVKQLEAFWWCATSASFATAAQRLHLSVSSLSKRIAELENRFGQQLFDRSGHKAVLTDAGRQLLPHALGVMNAMSVLEQAMQPSQALKGPCRVGVGDLSALTWLASFVGAVRQRHPDLDIGVSVDVGGELERQLAEGELDFAVIAGRSRRSDIDCSPVGSARFAWVAAPALVGPEPASVRELLTRHALITLPPKAGTTRLLDDWLLARPLGNPESTLTPIYCNSWAAVAGMLAAGVGIGFLPQGWAPGLGLTQLGTRTTLRPLHYTFQWRRGDTRALIPVLQQVVRDTVDFSAPLTPTGKGLEPLRA